VKPWTPIREKMNCKWSKETVGKPVVVLVFGFNYNWSRLHSIPDSEKWMRKGDNIPTHVQVNENWKEEIQGSGKCLMKELNQTAEEEDRFGTTDTEVKEVDVCVLVETETRSTQESSEEDVEKEEYLKLRTIWMNYV
jgi:hypothetical protein